MEKSSNKEIIDKVEEIVTFLENSQEYQEYLFLKKKMEDHPQIPSLIKKIKSLQKKLVKKSFQHEDTEEERKELSSLEKQLEEIPLYVDFLRVQEELNDVFSYLHDRIESLFLF